MKRMALAAATLAVTLTGPAVAQREALGPGDAAPGIDVDAWVIGQPVSMEPGSVYVVLFWEGASAGGASGGDAMKEMSLLRDALGQHGHRGLVVLVISTESADRIPTLARGFESVEGFTIATDRRDATNRGWIQQSQVRDLPVAFIVGRNGNIAHIGKPSDEGFTGILERVLNNRYDARLQNEAEPMIAAARRARKVRNWRMAKMHYDEVIALDGSVFADVALERFQMLIASADMGDTESAYEYAREQLIGKLFASDALALRDLATKIVLDPKIADDDRELDIALEAAEKAMAVSGPDDPESLATLALVKFHLGEIAEAVRLQTRAYFIARPKAKPAYKRVLKSYQDAMGRAGG